MIKKIIISFLILTLILSSASVSASGSTEPYGTEEIAETEENDTQNDPDDPCALSHDLIPVGEKRATCEEQGVIIAHYICMRCGKRFFDPAASLPVEDESSVISAPTGHDWGEWQTVKSPTETEAGLMCRYCKNAPEPVNKLRVTLDAGHGPFDNRGIIQEYYEGRRMFTLMTFLAEELSKYENIEIFTTRKEMSDAPKLESRGTLAAENGSELFISLHTNWFDSQAAAGVSVYRSYFRPESIELGTQLGLAVTDVINQATGITYMRNENTPMTRIEPAEKPENGDGEIQDYYSVIRNSVKSEACRYSFIIEHGFHSNYEECRFLLYDENLRNIAKAEADVIASYFGLYTKENVPLSLRHVEYKETDPTGSPSLPVNYELEDGFTANAETAVNGGTTVSFKRLPDEELTELCAALEGTEPVSLYELKCTINEREISQKDQIVFNYKLPDGVDASLLRLNSYNDGETEHVVLSYNAEDGSVSFRLFKAGKYFFFFSDSGYADYDVNGDGSVNNKDVVALFRFLSGDGLAAISLKAADVNEDGANNNKDVVYLFMYLSAAVREDSENG